jgi:hypothetical protein
MTKSESCWLEAGVYNSVMIKRYAGAYIVIMVVTVVAVDVAFFRHQFRERLIANLAFVLLFAVFYLLFLRRK